MPAFASVALHYDPSRVSTAGRGDSDSPYPAFVKLVTAALTNLEVSEVEAARVVEIPVCYGGGHGPDLDEVADHHGLAPADVVDIHVRGEYRVYMIGFAPGFAYLGGLAARIATPRRAEPRSLVPAGSVGIGGSQTGIYPLASPGGWRLIGRTPLRMFDATRLPPALLGVGDRVRFRGIAPNEFDSWADSG